MASAGPFQGPGPLLEFLSTYGGPRRHVGGAAAGICSTCRNLQGITFLKAIEGPVSETGPSLEYLLGFPGLWRGPCSTHVQQLQQHAGHKFLKVFRNRLQSLSCEGLCRPHFRARAPKDQ